MTLMLWSTRLKLPNITSWFKHGIRQLKTWRLRMNRILSIARLVQHIILKRVNQSQQLIMRYQKKNLRLSHQLLFKKHNYQRRKHKIIQNLSKKLKKNMQIPLQQVTSWNFKRQKLKKPIRMHQNLYLRSNLSQFPLHQPKLNKNQWSKKTRLYWQKNLQSNKWSTTTYPLPRRSWSTNQPKSNN